MKYSKKVSVGAFAKKGVDVNEGDLITIANEGKQIEGTFGPQDVFLVKLVNGEEKNINLNQTSLNGLIDAFGEDSVQWIGKQVKVWLISQNVAGKFVKVMYISHPRAELTQDGFVMPTVKGTSKKVQKSTEEEEYSDGEDIV